VIYHRFVEGGGGAGRSEREGGEKERKREKGKESGDESPHSERKGESGDESPHSERKKGRKRR
jgi:hypothetical protein